MQMKSPRKLLAFLLAVLMLSAMLPLTALAADSEEAAEVTVYFSRSHDDAYQVGKGSGEVMALKKITVPYFDLALYGLQDYYFSSETYTGDEDYDGTGDPSSDLVAGTAEFAKNKVTMLHLFIYATEVYYCGIDEADAGQGYLYKQKLLGTDTFTLTGSVGSSYLKMFWGQDENLNYYLNYEYPLASPGWGSTSDQILLEDGDIVTMGHFTNWQFHTDPGSVFNYLKAGTDTVTTTVEKGKSLTLTAYLAGASESGDYTTAHTVVTSQPEIYYMSVDELYEGDVTTWKLAGTASKNGTLNFDTSSLATGEYIFAMAGQYGENLTDAICSAPGAIRVKVIKYGDLNGNGSINIQDTAILYRHLKNSASLTDVQLAASDVNGDGKVNAVDAAMLYRFAANKLTAFPVN